MAVTVEVAKIGNAVVLAPRGSINTESAPKLEQTLAAQLGAGEKQLVVDFAGVDYISSAGLRLLLMTAKRLKVRGGAMALCSMSPAVAKVFALCGFERDFTIVETRDKAVARLSAATPPPPAPAPTPAAGAPAAAVVSSRPAPMAKAGGAGQAPPDRRSALLTAALRALSTGLPAGVGGSAVAKASRDAVTRARRALESSARYGK